MKIKDFIDIIVKNEDYASKIIKQQNNLRSLNYLTPDGSLKDSIKEQVDKGFELNPALLDYDKKILKFNNLKELITEYKEWLETEL